MGLLAGAEGQVGVQGAVLEHTHAVVGGNGGVCAAPFRDVVVGVPVFGQQHGADHVVQGALGPAIEADGQFLFHEFVERVHRKIGGDDDGQARSVVHVGERSHIFEGFLVRGLAVAGRHGVEGLGQGDVGGVLFKAEGVADRSALQHVDGAAGIAVVDQLADPGEADIPCAAEHRAAHGPEVDGFGVVSRGWGGEGEREADGASAGKRYGLVQEGHDGLLWVCGP